MKEKQQVNRKPKNRRSRCSQKASSDLICMIKRMRCESKGSPKHMTCDEIARILNLKGFTTLDGNPFSSYVVRKILNRPNRIY